MAEKIIPNLKMYPFETTLMGVLKGVGDYFGLAISDAWLFGGLGTPSLLIFMNSFVRVAPIVGTMNLSLNW